MKRIKTVTGGRLCYGVCYTVSTARDGSAERAAKSRISSAAQERVNLRRAWQKLEMTLAANFRRRDLHVVLTYADESLPPTRAAAVKLLRKFLGLLRRHRKARGQPLKYVYVTEQLSAEGGRLHHHLVLNGTGADLEVICSLWPYGEVEIERLDVWQGYEALAKYLTKEPREVGRSQLGARCWTPSLGLAKPVTETETVSDHVTLAAPPGALILDRHEERNEYGEYLYIKYWLPARREVGKKTRPRHRRRKE